MLKKGSLVKHKLLGCTGIVTKMFKSRPEFCEVYWQLTPKVVGLTKKVQKRSELIVGLELVKRGKEKV